MTKRERLDQNLELSGRKVGLLINFNVKFLEDGIRRVATDFPNSPRSLRPLW